MGLKDYYIANFDHSPEGKGAMDYMSLSMAGKIQPGYDIRDTPPTTNENGDIIHNLNNGEDRVILTQKKDFNELKNMGKEGDSIFVAAHGDTNKYAPDGSINLKDSNGNFLSQNDIANLNKNIRDSFGCNPKDGSINFFDYFNRWIPEL